MTAQSILQKVKAAGFKVSADGDALVVNGPRKLPDDLRKLLVEHKPTLLRELGTSEDDLIKLVCEMFDAQKVEYLTTDQYLARCCSVPLPNTRLEL